MIRVFKKVGFLWLCFLILYCSFLLSVVLFMCQLGVSTVFFMLDGSFLFSWKDALYLALKKGCIAGLVLGVGLWIKAKLQERKDKKNR
ncbi:hypothetical protein AAFN90_02600 [Erwiniaceae bacterium CAU 1747]